MKRILTVIISALALVSSIHADTPDIKNLLKTLEQTISESGKYDQEKNRHIESLRTRLSGAVGYDDRHSLTKELIREYEAYQCDSALRYVNDNIALSESQGNETDRSDAILSKCDILGRAGLFSEAMATLHTLTPSSLPPELRLKYYTAAYSINQYMFENTIGTEYEESYARAAREYCDSALSLSRPNSFDHTRLLAAKLINQNRDREAIAKLDSACMSYHEGQREFSILRSTQAFPESRINRESDEVISLLAESSISDIKGSIKENMAIRFLAELLYERGDIETANKFVKKSMEDASFFSARMRTTQVGQMLPLIDRQYDIMQHEEQSRIRLIMYIAAGVAILFAIGLFLIIRLTRRLSRANATLQISNGMLQESNDRIGILNSELRGAAEVTRGLNDKLKEANKIKETYLSQFIEMCSRSINSLDRFRKSMYLLQTTGKTEELKKSLKSSAIVSESVKELYANFDKAFLTIFPNFVGSFNALLREEEREELPPQGPFTTEMRIYALLRMGITDNHHIAEFLRCSLSTIYTYRSKMKARAIRPDTFEDEVMAISSIEP